MNVSITLIEQNHISEQMPCISDWQAANSPQQGTRHPSKGGEQRRDPEIQHHV